MKRCSKCKLDKIDSDFAQSKQSKDGLSGHCKSCKKLYYVADPEKVKQRNQEQKLRLRTRANEWKAQGCAVCGYDKYLGAIDAHHLHDKELSLYKLTGGTYSLERLERELTKCVPLCANCHRELHAGVITLEPV